MSASRAAEYSRRYRKRHPERVKAQLQSYYSRNREQMLERMRRWREQNPEWRAANQRWREQNRERAREDALQWRKRNPEKAREARRRRRVREVSALVEAIPADFVEQLRGFQGGCCAYCHEELAEFHVDHVVPLARGGAHVWENLVLACPSCNLRKGVKLPEELEAG